MASKPRQKSQAGLPGLADAIGAPPHFHGHRQRLRERLIAAGAESLPDYELMEVLLFAGNPRGDVKPLAKDLIERFGGFAEALSADPEALLAVPGLGRRGRRGAQIGARGGAAADEGGTARAAGDRLMGPADRLLPRPYRLRQGRGVSPAVPRPQERIDRP